MGNFNLPWAMIMIIYHKYPMKFTRPPSSNWYYYLYEKEYSSGTQGGLFIGVNFPVCHAPFHAQGQVWVPGINHNLLTKMPGRPPPFL